jgi:acetolactate synthase regulatory subunit
MEYTFNIIADNYPSVMYRITGIFMRRKISPAHMEVKTPSDSSKINISFTADFDGNAVDTIAKQMYKIVDVIDLKYVQSERT